LNLRHGNLPTGQLEVSTGEERRCRDACSGWELGGIVGYLRFGAAWTGPFPGRHL